MPTARELLEQADALMRRNRGGDTDIPILTDSVSEPASAPGRSGPSTRERIGMAARAPPDKGPWEDRSHAPLPENADRAVAPSSPVARQSDALAEQVLTGAAEPPLLTDAVEGVAVEVGPQAPATAEEDPSLWLGADTIDPALHSVTGPAPDTVAVVPPVTVRAPEPRPQPPAAVEERDPTITRTLRAAGSAPTPPPAGSMPPRRAEVLPGAAGEAVPTAGPGDDEPWRAEALPEAAADTVPTAGPGDDEPWRGEVPPEAAGEAVRTAGPGDDERWGALAEQISMQVLQRLDLFIDTGLKAQLAAHLQPIVARASAELVEAINDQVGQLVRTYVAEAIEREIAQWRQQNK